MSGIDVTEATFQTEVIDRSRDTPVIVDFWAEWCGPCRQLTPLLEKVVGESGGDVVLAKVDVDTNPRLAQAFGVQGIPAVKAIKDGKLVGEFTGAQPEQVVRSLVDTLRPSEADVLAAEADEESLRKALELDADHPVAVPKLAELLIEHGDTDEARELLRRVPETELTRRLLAELDLESIGADDSDDPAAAAVAAGDYTTALAEYLRRVQQSKDDAAREAIVQIFTALGNDDPLTREYRPKLAAALF